MATDTLEMLIKQSSTLTVDEQLRLAAYLVEQARQGYAPAPRRKWREIRGIAPYPLVGEDAQTWVTRTRREGDEERERQLQSASIGVGGEETLRERDEPPLRVDVGQETQSASA